tara:strand:- start:260 stop:523 length:264 start_codon:yes stop_codon:yes gene_type:complete
MSKKINETKKPITEIESKFADLLGGMAVGLGLGKVVDMLKRGKNARKAVDNWQKENERAAARIKKQIEAMPPDRRAEIERLQKLMDF